MVDIHDYDIQCVEEKILDKYNNFRPLSNYQYLLSLRKRMINKRVLAHQEEILQDIISFNDVLPEKLREMYDRAHRIWASIKDNEEFGEAPILTALCSFSNDYPELHPVQGEDREELWEALCDSGWNPLYEHGVTLRALMLSRHEEDETFESFIGMSCEPLNWNEGLDQELTKDLHLISAFHHLFDHMKFAITDILYVRKFETEFNIEIDEGVC